MTFKITKMQAYFQNLFNGDQALGKHGFDRFSILLLNYLMKKTAYRHLNRWNDESLHERELAGYLQWNKGIHFWCILIDHTNDVEQYVESSRLRNYVQTIDYKLNENNS